MTSSSSHTTNSSSTTIDVNHPFFFKTETIQTIWDDLAIRFAQSNLPRVFQLKKELMSLYQGSMSITAYFTKFRSLIDEMDDLSPVPRCTCLSTSCQYAFLIKLEEYEQVHKLSQFLMGLSDHLTDVRGQLLMMKPLPSLSQAYSLLLQEEVQRGCHTQGVPTENIAIRGG
ncbi:uncharacterized protein LOC141692029 [Apium graveolens]|uniref:uncharacterized protein LOC141692029 n=1 Tax=Apium graveolens TaxID=4045 RepID=UPI003D7C1158